MLPYKFMSVVGLTLFAFVGWNWLTAGAAVAPGLDDVMADVLNGRDVAACTALELSDAGVVIPESVELIEIS